MSIYLKQLTLYPQSIFGIYDDCIQDLDVIKEIIETKAGNLSIPIVFYNKITLDFYNRQFTNLFLFYKLDINQIRQFDLALVKHQKSIKILFLADYPHTELSFSFKQVEQLPRLDKEVFLPPKSLSHYNFITISNQLSSLKTNLQNKQKDLILIDFELFSTQTLDIAEFAAINLKTKQEFNKLVQMQHDFIEYDLGLNGYEGISKSALKSYIMTQFDLNKTIFFAKGITTEKKILDDFYDISVEVFEIELLRDYLGLKQIWFNSENCGQHQPVQGDLHCALKDCRDWSWVGKNII